MGLWPLYHFDDDVPCFKCGNVVGKARDGEVIGFGDGNGNRELLCACGLKTFFDATKSHDKAAAHAAGHAEALQRREATLRAQHAPKRPSRKTAKPAPGIAAGASAFDLPMGLGSLIGEAVKELKVKRNAR